MQMLSRRGATQQEVSDRVIDLIEGRSNATGLVTLTANATTTTVSKATINANAGLFLFPRTANAAAALATTHVSSVAAGSFVLTHANNAQTDRHFHYLVIGG
jgi:hypothetical protein